MISKDLGTSAEDFVGLGGKKSVMNVCFASDSSGAALSKATSVTCPGCFTDALHSTLASSDGLKTQILLFPDCWSDVFEQV